MEVKRGLEGAVHVLLSPVLLELNRRMLAAPDNAISWGWRMAMTQVSSQPAVVDLAGWPEGVESEHFVKMRKRYFEKIRTTPRDLVT